MKTPTLLLAGLCAGDDPANVPPNYGSWVLSTGVLRSFGVHVGFL